MVNQNNYNGDELVNKEFGINVGADLTRIDARVLPPPMVRCSTLVYCGISLLVNSHTIITCQLKYHETGKQALVEPSVGQWNMIDKVIFLSEKVHI